MKIINVTQGGLGGTIEKVVMDEKGDEGDAAKDHTLFSEIVNHERGLYGESYVDSPMDDDSPSDKDDVSPDDAVDSPMDDDSPSDKDDVSPDKNKSVNNNNVDTFSVAVNTDVSDEDVTDEVQPLDHTVDDSFTMDGVFKLWKGMNKGKQWGKKEWNQNAWPWMRHKLTSAIKQVITDNGGWDNIHGWDRVAEATEFSGWNAVTCMNAYNYLQPIYKRSVEDLVKEHIRPGQN